MSAREITLGALEKPLTEQLKGLLPHEVAMVFELHAKAISRCHIFGLISDAESDRARKRLIKKIQAKIYAEAK